MRFTNGVAVLMLVTGLLACESGSGSDPLPGDTPSIAAVNLAVPNATVSQGQQVNVGISVERGRGFNGAVTFTADNVPPGMTATFAPATIGTLESATTLRINALPTAAAGTYTITVRAQASGGTDRAVTIPVTVLIPAIALSAGSTTVTLPVTGTVTVPYTITRSGGYTEFVELDLWQVPTGVTASFDNRRIQPGARTATLTLSAPLGTPIGSGPLTIRARGDGPTAEQTIALNVVDAPTPVFQLVPGATGPLTLTRGASVTRTISTVRAGGLTGPIALSAEGLPAGVTATFSPSNPSGTATSTVTVTASNDAPIGNYPLVVRGSAPGATDRLISFTLLLNGPNGNGIQVLGVGSSPAERTIARGTTAVLNLTLALTGVTTPVTLTPESLPSGITVAPVTVQPPATGTGSVTVPLSISVAASAATGPQSVPLRISTPGYLYSNVVVITVTGP